MKSVDFPLLCQYNDVDLSIVPARRFSCRVVFATHGHGVCNAGTECFRFVPGNHEPALFVGVMSLHVYGSHESAYLLEL